MSEKTTVKMKPTNLADGSTILRDTKKLRAKDPNSVQYELTESAVDFWEKMDSKGRKILCPECKTTDVALAKDGFSRYIVHNMNCSVLRK